ncbi:glucose-6-phosphate isomerase 1, chloroplastic, partial [Tanacetum coccineum]
MFDSRKNNKGNDKKRKGAWNSCKNNKKDKKPLSEVVCYKCGEKGHIKRYCKNPKKKKHNSNKKDESANAVEQVDTTEITAMVSEMNIEMIHELHMASVTTTDDWWYDSGATTHVCNNRDLFKTYKETEDGHEVMMGDNLTSKAFETFKIYKAEVENQRAKKIQILRSDRGGEYFSTEFSSYCESQDSNVRVESRDVDFFENKFRHDSTSTNEIVTKIPQDIFGPNLNSNNKRNMAESSSAPRRSERARKERNLDPDFIDAQVIIFLVEGDNENNNPKKKNQNSNKKDESANAVEQVDITEITAMVFEMNIGMIHELHMASVTTTDDWCAGLRMFGSDTIKLDKMDGRNFTRWKEKTKFLLTAFKVYYVLEGPPIGVMTEEEERKREQDETLCRGYILSTLTDRLYDLYTPMTSAREIWNSLKEKYTTEKEGADKFITFKFFEFVMEDSV